MVSFFATGVVHWSILLATLPAPAIGESLTGECCQAERHSKQPDGSMT
jgi:hypothetical protein